MDHVSRVERNLCVYVVHVSKIGSVSRGCLGNTKKVAICASTSSKKRGMPAKKGIMQMNKVSKPGGDYVVNI